MTYLTFSLNFGSNYSKDKKVVTKVGGQHEEGLSLQVDPRELGSCYLQLKDGI